MGGVGPLRQGWPVRIGQRPRMEAGRAGVTCWLFKSEPDVWVWNHQDARSSDGEEWHEVRNYQPRNNVRAMKVFDQGFVYRSNVGRAAVGIVEVCRQSAPDSTTDDPRWDCVIIRALRPVARQSG